MNYFLVIQSLILYIENNIEVNIDNKKLNELTGFSLAHIRDIFKFNTNTTLARYILYRKISNAAYDVIHTDNSLIDISQNYGFNCYDTFTRSFKRITGLLPNDFRNKRYEVGRIKLVSGIYVPAITEKSIIYQVNNMEMNNMKEMKKTFDSCILYGVKKVEYCYEESTPFISSLKSCLNYMGQDINYSYLMAVSGAAFRLRWNKNSWDGGNIDVMNIYENPTEIFDKAFNGSGRDFEILMRNKDTKIEEFVKFIKREIDNGRPVIALGIIGPPEACIITGYRNNGELLLGWNFFQDNPEFKKDTKIDETGYFISNGWWENPHTIGLMSIGEEKKQTFDLKEILINAVRILKTTDIGKNAGGQKAYDYWKNSLLDDKQFPKGAVLSMLLERLMCQIDAMAMIGEGRGYAGIFLENSSKENKVVETECLKVAEYFKKEYKLVEEMASLLGGFVMGEKQALNLLQRETREEIAKIIDRAKNYDLQATKLIEMIIEKL